MEKLKTVSFNDQKVVLKNNIVESDILPGAMKEFGRDVIVDGETIIKGAVFARELQVKAGPLQVEGAVYVHNELHFNTDCAGEILFRKAVGSGDSVSCLLSKTKAFFLADISAKKIMLKNAFVSGSVLADEIDIENCVISGGAFATKRLSIKDSIVGTFNATSVLLSGIVYLLMPSAFSVEPIAATGDAEIWNMAAIDLGALCFGTEAKKGCGKIRMNVESDSTPINLYTKDNDKTVVRSFSVAGKVMVSDLLKLDELDNHFILRAASLAGHLEKTYGIAAGELDPMKIATALFKVMEGRTDIPIVDMKIDIENLKKELA
jgi:hypothetical protein